MAVTVEGDDLFRYRIGSEKVVSSVETIEQLINNLEVKYPGFRDDVLSDSNSSFRENVIVALNGLRQELWSSLCPMGTKSSFLTLKAEDKVSFLKKPDFIPGLSRACRPSGAADWPG
jgi:hypothetical protein